ncbi:MAG: TlpA disulfide reductase family protein [Nocardioides sp.]
MRRLLLAALAAALLLSGCADDPAAPSAAQVDVDTPQLRELKGRTAVEDCVPGEGADGALPDLTLPCLGGGPDVDLAGLEGPMVINLWASFCGPCRKEMPALQEFYEGYGEQVGVIGIDYQDLQPADALELARKTGVSYPLLADPGGDLNARDPLPVIRGLPYLVFLDADGEVTAVPGGVDSAEELVELANEHLGTDL